MLDKALLDANFISLCLYWLLLILIDACLPKQAVIDVISTLDLVNRYPANPLL